MHFTGSYNRGATSKMRIYNVKEINIKKPNFNAEKLGFFVTQEKAPDC